MELHPDSETIPLLIEGVSNICLLVLKFFVFFAVFDTAMRLSLINDISLDSHHLIFFLPFASVVFVYFWVFCFLLEYRIQLILCFVLGFFPTPRQRINSGSYGLAATESWMDGVGPKTRRVM